LRRKIRKNPLVAIRIYPLNRLVGVYVKAVNKQRSVLGPVGIPAVFQDVIGEGTDGVEVFAALIWLGSLSSEAD
jgi:hypothetical protein